MKALLKKTLLGKALISFRNKFNGNLTLIEQSKVSQKLLDGWKSADIPNKQGLITNEELSKMYSGVIMKPFQVLADCIKLINIENSKMIEIGCSTGYYYEVLSHLLGTKIQYTGVDYSAPMINEAIKKYKDVTFKVADATELPFKDREFDVVISGCCLLHIADYSKAISESVRIARQWVIFHRTPVVKGPTQYFQKKAYGVPCVEIHFNEDSFIEICSQNQLSLRYTFDDDVTENEEFSHKTYVFEKAIMLN